MTTVESPTTLRAALEALAAYASRATDGGAQVLAGGTDLMVEFENGRTEPGQVVDIWRVAELRGIGREDGDGALRIGALTTCTELLEHPDVRAHADILVASARDFGAVQIRNRATIGGNLGTASPAADLNPALVALSARVRLASLHGSRELPVDEFLTGYRATARRPDELIEAVLLPPRPAGERRAFRKIGTRRAQSIAKVVVAVAVELSDGGEVRSLRAAAGSVAPRTVLLPALADDLRGRRPSGADVRRAVRAALQRDVAPIDDVRSTAAYRRQALGRVLLSMLGQMLGVGG